jgi:arginase
MLDQALGIIGVPSSAGAHNTGQETTPDLLRQLGLVDRLQSTGLTVVDQGNTTLRPFRVDENNTHARNADEVLRTLFEVRDAVSRSLAQGMLPIVLGGDCTITLGVATAFRQHFDDVGLLYFDGDADLVTPETTASGILDAMVAAHVLGEADSVLTSIWDGGRLLGDDQIALLGYNPDDPDSFDQEILERHPLLSHTSFRQLAEDPHGCALRAVERIARPERHLLVHFDVDSIDSGEMPLADFPHYATGLSVKAAQTVLTTLMRAPRVSGAVFTEVNPTHDTTGTSLDHYLELICEAIAAAFTPSS